LEHTIQADVKQLCEKEYKRKLSEMRNEMEDKHAKELETRTEAERKRMTEQLDEVTTILKNMAEEEQVCLTLMGFPIDEMQIL
jgi:DNA anti-recombination protein RmuC